MVNVSTAGRLKHFHEQWCQVTKDEYVLAAIRGYRIPFNNTPTQSSEPRVKINCDQEKEKITDAVSKLLRSGAICVSHEQPDQFVSSVFSVPKSDGSVRLVINLKPLNEFIYAPHFKMEDYRTSIQLLRPHSYMAIVDLKEAYHAIPVADCDQRFLKFRWNDILYQFTCLPFGLNIAPYVYTKVMRPVFAFLRSQGHQSVSFLDDCMLIGDRHEDCMLNVTVTASLYKKLGLIINEEKSILTPVTKVKFLGFVFDTNNFTISLPASKREKIFKMLATLLNETAVQIQFVAEVLGVLNSATPAVPYGPVYLKQLEHERNVALRKCNYDYSQIMYLSNEAKIDMKWWLDNIDNATMSLTKDKFDKCVTCDASTRGWGSECNGVMTKGTWNASEKQLHINELELLAIYYALQSFESGKSERILIRSDNTTAISYVNNYGGCRATGCNSVAKNIWKWAETHKIRLFASYINTKENVIADFLSRQEVDSSDFQLNIKYYRKICETFGAPDVDLFATRLTRQCKTFVSWLPDPESSAVDAFTIQWSNNFYSFPPFCLINRVLNKIIEDQVFGVVVVPNWCAQSWYPRYMKMCTGRILYFQTKDVLWCPYENRIHPMSRNITLMAAVLSPNL